MDELDLGQTIRGLVGGQELFGRYLLVRIIGRGGMGVVWLARDEKLDRDVALKFLPELVMHESAVLDDLKRETKRSLELTHHNIVRIYDFAEDNQTACISMEYVDGPTLSALRVDRPCKVFEVDGLKAWVKQTCEALDYAHNHARIVHRDLKPANLMLNSKGHLKVTDFGIARSLTDSVTMLTKVSGASGTLVYMSPQQLDGERTSHLDDIYSLGATLYELLTSKPPFFTGNVDRQIREKTPLPIAHRREELDITSDQIVAQQWEETIAACLAKDPAQRPQSASEVARRLELSEPAAPAPAQKNLVRSEITHAPVKAVLKGKKHIIAVALATLLMTGIVGWWFEIERSRREAERQRQIATEKEKEQYDKKATQPDAPKQDLLLERRITAKAVTTQSSPSRIEPSARRTIEPWLGLYLEPITKVPFYEQIFTGVEQGLVVRMVEPASPAAKSELWNLDVITHIDGRSISTLTDARNETAKRKPGDTTELTVLRRRQVLKIPVSLGGLEKRFVGAWEGLNHYFKFPDKSGQGDYQHERVSRVRATVNEDETQVEYTDPGTTSQEQAQRHTPSDWWFHLDAQTLASNDNPQVRMTILGDGRAALLSTTAYWEDLEGGSYHANTRCILQKSSIANDSESGKTVASNNSSKMEPKVEITLRESQISVGETTILRIHISGASGATVPNQISIDGLEVAFCGVSPPVEDSASTEGAGVAYDYVILSLKPGRFTIPSQAVQARGVTSQTSELKLDVSPGLPRLPTSKDWLIRYVVSNFPVGNLLPAVQMNVVPSYNGPTEPMVYKRFGKQKLSRLVVQPFHFAVQVPIDVFPNAAAVLSKGNILMPPNAVTPHVIYYPARPLNSFLSLYQSFASDPSKCDPMKVVHNRMLRENSFVVQAAWGSAGSCYAAFKKGDSVYLMGIAYRDDDCPFTAETLKAMTDSFIANSR